MSINGRLTRQIAESARERSWFSRNKNLQGTVFSLSLLISIHPILPKLSLEHQAQMVRWSRRVEQEQESVGEAESREKKKKKNMD